MSKPGNTLEANQSPGYWRLMPCLALVATILALLVVSSPAYSQLISGAEESVAPVELPENLTREEVRDLVARMSDDEVRELIISQLDKLADQAQTSDIDTADIYVSQLIKGVEVAASSLERVFTSGGDVYALPISIWQQITDYGGISGAYLLFQLLGLLLVGLAVGLSVSLFQALTSVQEQTMSLVPKMLAVMIVTLVLLAPALRLLSDFTTRIFGRLVEFGLS